MKKAFFEAGQRVAAAAVAEHKKHGDFGWLLIIGERDGHTCHFTNLSDENKKYLVGLWAKELGVK